LIGFVFKKENHFSDDFEYSCYTRDSLPIEMHINHHELVYVRKNDKGAFEINSFDFYSKDPETVLGTE